MEFYFENRRLASMIQQRQSLHRSIESSRHENHRLKTQLFDLQPLADLGSASCMIAHEINNLLTPLGTLAQLALNHPDDAALVEKALTKAVINCRRASAVMESMMGLANGQKQPMESIRVKDVIEEVFTCLCRDFSKDRITVHRHIPFDLYVDVIPVQIQQVFMNLILNAREAMLPRGGTLTIRAEQRAPYVCIEIIDTGAGIPPEEREHIFKSFYTTKDSSTKTGECFGTGLGLVFCRTVVEAHGGHIHVSSEVGKGTTFRILLPEESVNDKEDS
jgi:signal transduction histidine kinase